MAYLLELQRREARKEALQGNVDRSQDLRVILDYYKRYKEKNQIDALEAEAQMRKQGWSTDLVPDRCIYDRFVSLLPQARPFNLRASVNMRELNPSDIDKLVSVKGMVIRSSSIIPEIKGPSSNV